MHNFKETESYVTDTGSYGPQPGCISGYALCHTMVHTAKSKIAVYLNFEVLGAPNGGRMIMGTSDGVTPKGSEKTTQLYVDYFKSKNTPYFIYLTLNKITKNLRRFRKTPYQTPHF